MQKIQKVFSYFCLVLFLAVSGQNAIASSFSNQLTKPIKSGITQTGKHAGSVANILFEEINEVEDDDLADYFIVPFSPTPSVSQSQSWFKHQGLFSQKNSRFPKLAIFLSIRVLRL